MLSCSHFHAFLLTISSHGIFAAIQLYADRAYIYSCSYAHCSKRSSLARLKSQILGIE